MKKKIKFAVLAGNGSYFRVTEVAKKEPKNFGGDEWVVVADDLEKHDLLSRDEIKGHMIVHRPERKR